MVAEELALDLEAVTVDTQIDEDTGPHILSRGVSVVYRAIQSACQAIQRQRFRQPLPIAVRRTIRISRSNASPAQALVSYGAAAVEASLHPSSMEVEVRSVTLCVYAGKILDRGAAEAELRNGIYHALEWALHPSTSTRPYHRTTTPPTIKVLFHQLSRRDHPTGLAQLPYSTIPAALTSALSQASGLYLDTIPVRADEILTMLKEE